MTTLEEKLITMGMQKLNYVQNTLKNSVGDKKLEKYWKILMARIDEFPLECAICDTRDAVEQMWTKCLKNEEALHVLKGSCSYNVSEDTLAMYQRELQELNSFYLRNRELIDMITEYDNLWKRLTNLRRDFNNPDRLFKNRGARLLQEEEDRKVIRKLPRVEKSILRLLEKQRTEGQEEFLVRGEVFAELAKRRWDEYKENTNTEQVLPKKILKTPDPPCAGSVTKRRNLQEMQTSSEVKRKRSLDEIKFRPAYSTGSLESKGSCVRKLV